MHKDNLKSVPAGTDAKAALEEVRQFVFGPGAPKKGSPEAALPYLRCEHMLVRFLVAHKWDAKAASSALSEHYRWLAETRMAQKLLEPFPDEDHIKRYYPQAYHGTDRRGRPIYIERLGLLNLSRLLEAVSPSQVVDFICMNSEVQVRRRLPACSLLRGEVVDKSLNILDLSGVGLGLVTDSAARAFLKDIVSTMQSHYPEITGQTVIINAPRVFNIAWSFIKPFLNEQSLSMISIYGTSRREYSKALLDLVHPSQLPQIFGGDCVCDGKDPLSCMVCTKGPWCNPEIISILDAEPLDFLLSPEGASLWLKRKQEKENRIEFSLDDDQFSRTDSWKTAEENSDPAQPEDSLDDFLSEMEPASEVETLESFLNESLQQPFAPATEAKQKAACAAPQAPAAPLTACAASTPNGVRVKAASHKRRKSKSVGARNELAAADDGEEASVGTTIQRLFLRFADAASAVAAAHSHQDRELVDRRPRSRQKCKSVEDFLNEPFMEDEGCQEGHEEYPSHSKIGEPEEEADRHHIYMCVNQTW